MTAAVHILMDWTEFTLVFPVLAGTRADTDRQNRLSVN